MAIVGSGAMGAMYAWHFVAAGIDTRLVARGERADRLRSPGLTVNGQPLRAEVVDPFAGEDPRSADLVLVAVKHHQLAGALEDVAPLVDDRTTFLSVLNGLDSEQVIAERFGGEQVLLSIALAMSAHRDGNAAGFRQAGQLKIGLGPGLGTEDRLGTVCDVLDRAGLAWESSDDMRHEMWWKFMVNTSVNQPSAVMRAPFRDFQRGGSARSLLNALVAEVLAVANAEGIDLGPADVESWHQVLSGLPPEGFSSMAQDVLAGRPTEVDLFGGHVVALGAKHGIPTPYNQTMVWLLS